MHADKLPLWANPNFERFVVTERLLEITPTHFITQNGACKNSYHKGFYKLAEQERGNEYE
jgi:hypothetical protein